MKNYIIILLLAISQCTFAQEKWSQETEVLINRIIHAKVNYEQYRSFSEKRPQQYATKRDSCYHIYTESIKSLKNDPKTSIGHIDYVISQPKGPKDFNVHYSYTSERNIGLPYDRNKFTISKKDLYRVIKYYLFTQNADSLPELLDDVTIPIKRDHHPPFKLQTIEDMRRDSAAHER